jgi:hypothetical protein
MCNDKYRKLIKDLYIISDLQPDLATLKNP